jgi:flagellar motility protein MotE (MotC chaperone)
MRLPSTGEWADIFFVENNKSWFGRKHKIWVKAESGKLIKVLETADSSLATKGAEALNNAYRYGIMVGKESVIK